MTVPFTFQKITPPNTAMKLSLALREHFESDEIRKREHFKVLMLDFDMNVLGCIHAGTGDKHTCPVSFRSIAKGIADLDPVFLVLGHNHPGGKLFPSAKDMILTEQLEKLASLLGVCIMDHIILTATSFYSFVLDGKLKIGN